MAIFTQALFWVQEEGKQASVDFTTPCGQHKANKYFCAGNTATETNLRYAYYVLRGTGKVRIFMAYKTCKTIQCEFRILVFNYQLNDWGPDWPQETCLTSLSQKFFNDDVELIVMAL